MQDASFPDTSLVEPPTAIDEEPTQRDTLKDALATLPGRFEFASAMARDEAAASLAAAGAIVVEIEGVGPSMRGRFAEAIDEAIERELTGRGAAGAGFASAGDRDATLSDQLFRARRVGATGIAIVLGPLRAAVGARGALRPEDCDTLRFLAAATRERPVVLIVDERDEGTRGYGEPVGLGEVLGGSADADADAGADASAGAGASAGADVSEVGVGVGVGVGVEGEGEGSVDCDDRDEDEYEGLSRHTAGASVVEREEAWRGWTLALTAARGPQALGALEKLFVESYMPLANALGAGLEDPRARGAHDDFRAAFAKSYTEAFPAFASTAKRPRMVLDAHPIAAHTARLHGARSTRMLLVDAMRWDLSRLVTERLVARLGPRAVLTDEMILWSALPTTTLRQLETIARGMDALRAPAEGDMDNDPPRARTADYVRRLRVGPREVHKLDIVEARLESARGGVQRALPEIAERAAEAIARHALTLPAHTLLFVFGDHGFSVDRTGVARQGGASPEEVLVGAFALLVGDVH